MRQDVATEAELIFIAATPPHLNHLPVELQMKIYKNLGPVTQRILGSTSKKMYSIWKTYYYEKKVRIDVNEFHPTSVEHTRFIATWILHHWPDRRDSNRKSDEENDLIEVDVDVTSLALHLGRYNCKKFGPLHGAQSHGLKKFYQLHVMILQGGGYTEYQFPKAPGRIVFTDESNLLEENDWMMWVLRTECDNALNDSE